MTRTTAKIFRNGRSQAVRLPKEFRFAGNEVYIEKRGDTLVLSPKDRPWAEGVLRRRGAVVGLGAKLAVSPLQKLGPRGRNRHAVHCVVAGARAQGGDHERGRAYHRLSADIS